MTDVRTLPALTKPTSDDVATLLRARTKDLDGAELGVFTANTRPTATEVARIIDLAYAEVTGRVGAYLGDRCADMARTLVVVRAAAWVELSYWPEQVRSDRSVYAELIDQWTTGLPGLVECAEGNLPGDGDGDTKAGYRFGVLDVHGWTASPYYGAPDIGAADTGGTVGPPGPQGPPGPVGPAGASLSVQEVEYTYSTTITPGPSSGQIRFDNAGYSGVTHVYASDTSADGVDQTRWLTVLRAGDRIDIQDKDDASRWLRLAVVGLPVAGVNDVDVPAAYVVDSGVPLLAQRVIASLVHVVA